MLSIPALAMLMLIGSTKSADAQAFEIGPRIGYEVDAWDALSVGADARLAMGALPVRVNPYFDYYLTDDIGNRSTSLVQLGLNALYEFGVANQAFTPYAGAGLAVTRWNNGITTDTNPGLNLIFGSKFGFGSVRPFVQADITVGDRDFFNVRGGVLFPMGF
jgi:opacity protein-like surface antigen